MVSPKHDPASEPNAGCGNTAYCNEAHADIEVGVTRHGMSIHRVSDHVAQRTLATRTPEHRLADMVLWPPVDVDIEITADHHEEAAEARSGRPNTGLAADYDCAGASRN